MEETNCLYIDLTDLYDEDFYRPDNKGEYFWKEMSYYWLEDPDVNDEFLGAHKYQELYEYEDAVDLNNWTDEDLERESGYDIVDALDIQNFNDGEDLNIGKGISC